MIPQINGKIENEGVSLDEIDLSNVSADDIRKLTQMFRDCSQIVMNQQQALKEAQVIIKHLEEELRKARG